MGSGSSSEPTPTANHHPPSKTDTNHGHDTNHHVSSFDRPYRSTHSSRPTRSSYTSPPAHTPINPTRSSYTSPSYSNYPNRSAYGNYRPNRSTSSYVRSMSPDFYRPIRGSQSQDLYQPLRNSNYSYNLDNLDYRPQPMRNYRDSPRPINSYSTPASAGDVVKYTLCIALKGNTIETRMHSMVPDTEIIEVAIVLVDNAQKYITQGQFHSYVQPRLRPLIEPRCLEMYQIYQYAIDEAEFWPQVEQKTERWLREKGIHMQLENFIVAADGESGYAQLIQSQSQISGTRVPDWSRRWIDIRKELKTIPIHKYPESIDRLVDKGIARDEAFDVATIIVALLRMDHAFENVENLDLLDHRRNFY